MSDSSQYVAPGRGASQPTHADTRVQTGWVGWVVFAGVMLVLLGAFHVIQGLVAIFRDEEVYLVNQGDLIVNVDYTAWGWTHLIGGVVAILAGVCLLAGQMWARIVAVVIALLSAIVNVAFLPAFPIWSALMIGIDIVVIWAVTVHGAELK
jgi:hypothetical protein